MVDDSIENAKRLILTGHTIPGWKWPQYSEEDLIPADKEIRWVQKMVYSKDAYRRSNAVRIMANALDDPAICLRRAIAFIKLRDDELFFKATPENTERFVNILIDSAIDLATDGIDAADIVTWRDSVGIEPKQS